MTIDQPTNHDESVCPGLCCCSQCARKKRRVRSRSEPKLTLAMH